MIKKLITLFAITLFSLSGNSYAQDKMPSKQDIATYKNDLARVQDYLNNITTLVASFSQVDAEGEAVEGTFYLSRPGKLRWEYYPPSPILIVAKGSLLAYYDSELDQVSYVTVDDGLASFLTRKVISFNDKNIEIIRFEKTDDEITIAISKKNNSDEGQLTLVFSNKEIALKKMEMLDAVGKVTKVYFSNLVYDKPLEDKLFIMPRTKRKQ